ncbi:hypothetical protein [Pedobacter sp. V48]|nr:hypothetical protein [Pedobacter sp. V48]ETZ22380.1 hypothetical protein N824_01665 [Pedobacter sp. V48]
MACLPGVIGTAVKRDEGILRIHFPEFSKSDDLEAQPRLAEGS